MKKLILLTCLLLTFNNYAFADDSGNSDETLQTFNPETVLADNNNPAYVTNYIDTSNHHPKSTTDFSIGINVGINIDSFELTQSDGVIKRTDNFNSTGAFGALTFGYGKKVLDDNMYIGLAIDGAFNGGEYRNEFTIGNTKSSLTINMPYSFGAYFVPGFMLTPHTMLFAKLGGAFSEFRLKTNDPLFFAEDEFSQSLPGFRAGIGLQTFVVDSLSFDVNYMFSYYADAHHDFQGIKNTYSPLTNQISIGFAWHFI